MKTVTQITRLAATGETWIKEEVDKPVKANVLGKMNTSECVSLAFTIAKPDGSLRSLTDNRAINKHIKRCPFPIPRHVAET